MKANNTDNLCLLLFASVCWCVYQAIRSVLWQDVYPQIKLSEFYQVKVDRAVERFRTLLQNGLYSRSVNLRKVLLQSNVNLLMFATLQKTCQQSSSSFSDHIRCVQVQNCCKGCLCLAIHKHWNSMCESVKVHSCVSTCIDWNRGISYVLPDTHGTGTWKKLKSVAETPLV